jgi:hypothetical protein
MPHATSAVLFALLVVAADASAQATVSGVVYEDANGNGQHDARERGIADVKVSNGRELAITDAKGGYTLPRYATATGANGLPLFWHHVFPQGSPKLRYGGIAATGSAESYDFALRREKKAKGDLDVLVFGDPQPKSRTDVGYYERDIVQPLVGHHDARLGISLGDIVNDDLSLYPEMNRVTAKLGVPWLHVPGNHDLDFDATRDEDALLGFRNVFGPDSYAWEEPQASFIVLDDVVYMPGRKPSYVGGLREDQFAFLEAYLATQPKQRRVVIAVHIPFFDPVPGVESFRRADRERLFALLEDRPNVVLLSAHTHNQRHYHHDASTGWRGAKPLNEYNVGATCGAFWSGVKDANGIPDTMMSDGTPNGSAQAKFANVYMGEAGSRVEYRIDDGEWKAMKRVEQPDPRLVAKNIADDHAEALRGYDRSPEADPSTHLWRGTLPTDLALGDHRIEVRAFDRWQGEQRAQTHYRLDDATE